MPSLLALVALITYAVGGNFILRSWRIQHLVVFTLLVVVILTAIWTIVSLRQAPLGSANEALLATALSSALIVSITLAIVGIAIALVSKKDRVQSYAFCIAAAVASWVFLPAFALPIACYIGHDCI